MAQSFSSVNSGRPVLDAGGYGNTLPYSTTFGNSFGGGESFIDQTLPWGNGVPLSTSVGRGGAANPFSMQSGPPMPQVFQSGPLLPQVVPSSLLANTPPGSARYTTVPGPPPMYSSPITMMQSGPLQQSVRALPAERISTSMPEGSSAQLPASQTMGASSRYPEVKTIPYSASSLGTSLSLRPNPAEQPGSAHFNVEQPYQQPSQQPSRQPSQQASTTRPPVDSRAQFARDFANSRSQLAARSSNTAGAAARQALANDDEVEQGNFAQFCQYSAAKEPIKESFKSDFGLSGHGAIHDAMVYMGHELAQGLQKMDFDQAEEVELDRVMRPYGMTKEKHEEYSRKLEAHKKAERPSHHKVEMKHVEAVHHHVELAKAGRLEKDLMHLREDQLERRFAMLEQIAAAVPVKRPEEEEDENPRDINERLVPVSPYMDKFLPVPLGGGPNWHYFNHYEGYYIDRNKIAQREAQLRYMQDVHQHQFIYDLAGKWREEIPEEYWVRDHRSFLKEGPQGPNVFSMMNKQDLSPSMMNPFNM